MFMQNQDKVEVAVISDIDGIERISLRMEDGRDATFMKLTPAQARMLATELISAVNRAEVKDSLKANSNLWRRTEETTLAWGRSDS